MPTIYLFDVDGTLVTTDGAGRRAYEAAFADLFGADESVLDFSFAGMTDPLLVRRGLEAAGREPTREALDAVFEAYLERLPETIRATERYRVHPGVEERLEMLRGDDGVAIGLGTGNLEAGARHKLDPAGLNDHFGFGGFGSDASKRADLLRAGARRGASRLETPIESCHIVVIGDTPRDIDAARAIGAECLAVCTGGYDREDLADHEPDRLVETLDSREAQSFLTRERRP